MNKYMVRLVGALAVGGVAPLHAGVTLGTDSPAVIAAELAQDVIPNVAARLDLEVPLAYALSAGEVRYIRIECSPAMRFEPGSTIGYIDGGGEPGTLAIGASDAAEPNVLRFNITAGSSGVGDSANDRFVVDGDRGLEPGQDASCAYGIYDTPSASARGADEGRIAVREGRYLVRESAYVVTVEAAPAGRLVAEVDAPAGPYRRFDGLLNPLHFTDVVAFGRIRVDARPGEQIGATGVDVDLADLFDLAGGVRIEGDFSTTVDGDGGWSGAPQRIYLGDDRCEFATAAAAVSEAEATFDIPAAQASVCYAPNLAFAIPESSYRLTFAPIAMPGYAIAPLVLDLASVRRGGTELQVPMVDLQHGIVRVALTNTDNREHPFTIEALGFDEGAGARVTLHSGVIPAESGVVVGLDSLREASPSSRVAVIVTSTAPSRFLQGQLQHIDPASGAVGNAVMQRPVR